MSGGLKLTGVMSHSATGMAMMEDPGEGFSESVSNIDDTGNGKEKEVTT